MKETVPEIKKWLGRSQIGCINEQHRPRAPPTLFTCWRNAHILRMKTNSCQLPKTKNRLLTTERRSDCRWASVPQLWKQDGGLQHRRSTDKRGLRSKGPTSSQPSTYPPRLKFLIISIHLTHAPYWRRTKKFSKK